MNVPGPSADGHYNPGEQRVAADERRCPVVPNRGILQAPRCQVILSRAPGKRCVLSSRVRKAARAWHRAVSSCRLAWIAVDQRPRSRGRNSVWCGQAAVRRTTRRRSTGATGAVTTGLPTAGERLSPGRLFKSPRSFFNSSRTSRNRHAFAGHQGAWRGCASVRSRTTGPVEPARLVPPSSLLRMVVNRTIR